MARLNYRSRSDYLLVLSIGHLPSLAILPRSFGVVCSYQRAASLKEASVQKSITHAVTISARSPMNPETIAIIVAILGTGLVLWRANAGSQKELRQDIRGLNARIDALYQALFTRKDPAA